MLCRQKKDATHMPRRRDQMQTRRSIQRKVPGRELDFVGTAEVSIASSPSVRHHLVGINAEMMRIEGRTAVERWRNILPPR